MSEEMLSGEERNALLKQVFTPVNEDKEVNTPKSNDELSEGKTDLSQASFGDLLEQSIAIREGHVIEDKKEEEHIDETRDQAIKLSRMDILEGWNL